MSEKKDFPLADFPLVDDSFLNLDNPRAVAEQLKSAAGQAAPAKTALFTEEHVSGSDSGASYAVNAVQAPGPPQTAEAHVVMAQKARPVEQKPKEGQKDAAGAPAARQQPSAAAANREAAGLAEKQPPSQAGSAPVAHAAAGAGPQQPGGAPVPPPAPVQAAKPSEPVEVRTAEAPKAVQAAPKAPQTPAPVQARATEAPKAAQAAPEAPKTPPQAKAQPAAPPAAPAPSPPKAAAPLPGDIAGKAPAARPENIPDAPPAQAAAAVQAAAQAVAAAKAAAAAASAVAPEPFKTQEPPPQRQVESPSPRTEESAPASAKQAEQKKAAPPPKAAAAPQDKPRERTALPEQEEEKAVAVPDAVPDAGPDSGRASAASAAQGEDREEPGKPGSHLGPDLKLDAADRKQEAPGGSGGGAWLWLPQGVEPRRSWPKRHPVLFWGGVILLLLFIFSAGRLSTLDYPMLGNKLAIINVEGVILDSTKVVGWIEQVEKDETFKGALIRINSPGGAVGPSQEIYSALKRLQKIKPVVASMGALAASGGYYIALASDEIFAGPSTLTASIGVKMQVPNMEGLMRTLGISEKTLATGALKDAGSAWREMTPEEEAYFTALLEDMNEEFVMTVAKERDINTNRVRTLADGRAMTGRQAVRAGLVDSLGDQHDALVSLKGLCEIDVKAPVSLVPGPDTSAGFVKEFLLSLFRESMKESMVREQPVFLYY